MTADPDEGQPPTGTDEDAQLIAGRYRLLSELGGGAMGVVWRARDEVLGRDVAVKELRPDTGMSGAQVKQSHLRARREGRIAARLQHPNAVTIYDVAEHAGRPYLIMEFVPSSNLADILNTGTVMTPAEVARIGAQLASALAAAHTVGIVHRDIKPGNVLMTADGTVKLTDFGISRATGDATVTATGEILGTPAYTAPEVAQGAAVDFTADVFSLGATLYAAVEGTPPFGDEVNAMAVLLRVVRNEIRMPRRSGMLTDTIMRMLSPEPADRPTMREAWQAFDALSTASLPVVDARSAGLVPETKQLVVEPTPTTVLPTEPAPEAAATPVDVEPLGPAPDASGPLAADPLALTPMVAEPTAAPESTSTPSEPAPTAPPAAPPPVPAASAPETASAVEVGATTSMPKASPTQRSLPRVGSRGRLALAGGAVGVAGVIGAIVAFSGGGGHNPPATPVAHPATTSHATTSTSAPTTASSSAPSTPAPSSSASSSAPAAPPSSASSSPSSPSSPATTSSSSSADVATQMSTMITTYYSQVVGGDLSQTWTRLTADYQQNTALGFANYQKFWQGMEKVTCTGVEAKAPDTVTATIGYFPKNGAATQERTRFTLVQEGGVWKIAHSVVVG